MSTHEIEREIHTLLVQGLLREPRPTDYRDFLLVGTVIEEDGEAFQVMLSSSDNFVVVLSTVSGAGDCLHWTKYTKYRVIVSEQMTDPEKNLLLIGQKEMMWHNLPRTVAVYLIPGVTREEVEDNWERSGYKDIYLEEMERSAVSRNEAQEEEGGSSAERKDDSLSALFGALNA